MADYLTVEGPRALSYGAPLIDFGIIGDLANSYYKGQRNQREQDVANAFKDQPLPLDPQTGLPDYGKIMQVLAQKGGIDAITRLAQPAAEQSLISRAGQLSPLLTGGFAPGAGGGGGAAPPGAITSDSIPTPSGARASPSYVQGGDNAGSVVDIVSSKLPQDSQSTGAVIANIARSVGVDPNAALTSQQSATVQRRLDAYLSRTQGRTAQAATPAPQGAASTQPTGGVPTPTDAEMASARARLARQMSPAGASAFAPTNSEGGASPVAAVPVRVPPAAAAAQPSAAAQPAASPQARPQAPAAAAPAPAAAPAQPAGPIVPQVPLPRGFTDPQQAILALRSEAARLSVNPYAKGQVAELNDWADRIEKNLAPMEVRPGTTIIDPRSGRVLYQAPGANAANLALQRYLQENPNASAEEIQGFLQRGRAGRSAISMYMQRYLEEHPDATADDVKRAAQLYTTQTTAQNRFLSGPQGNTIRSLNVVVSHLQTMQDLGDALNNGNIRLFNRVAQRFAEETGDPAPTNFDTAKQIVGAEVIKALGVAGAGSQAERQEAADAFNRARSPAQLAGAISSAKKLLVGQLSGLRRQYVAATGLTESSFDQMLEPETRSFFDQGGGERGGGVAPQSQSQPKVMRWERGPDGNPRPVQQ